MQFIKSNVFQDPTPKGIINQRFLKDLLYLINYTDLSEKEKDEFFNILTLVGKKLVAVWIHLERYNKYENEQIKKARNNPITENQKVIQLDISQELFLEFDEFLVQVKSTLDYLVKMPAVIFGHNRWTLRTFGKKGKDVKKSFINNVPKNMVKKVQAFIHLINLNEDWLSRIIEARDKINHFFDGGINYEYFKVIVLLKNGKEELKIPMWSPNQSIRELLDVIWTNLFKFCETFVGLLLACRVKESFSFFHGPDSLSSIKSPWKVMPKHIMDKEVQKPGWKKF